MWNGKAICYYLLLPFGIHWNVMHMLSERVIWYIFFHSNVIASRCRTMRMHRREDVHVHAPSSKSMELINSHLEIRGTDFHNSNSMLPSRHSFSMSRLKMFWSTYSLNIFSNCYPTKFLSHSAYAVRCWKRKIRKKAKFRQIRFVNEHFSPEFRTRCDPHTAFCIF